MFTQSNQCHLFTESKIYYIFVKYVNIFNNFRESILELKQKIDIDKQKKKLVKAYLLNDK